MGTHIDVCILNCVCVQNFLVCMQMLMSVILALTSAKDSAETLLDHSVVVVHLYTSWLPMDSHVKVSNRVCYCLSCDNHVPYKN